MYAPDSNEVVIWEKSIFRAAYTARIGDFVYVLDVFKKKSRTGNGDSTIPTLAVLGDACARLGSIMKNKIDDVEFATRTGSVWDQLGYPNAAEMQRKSLLMIVIGDALKRQKLTQKEAAKKLGMSQADISRIGTGKGFRFSIDRLLNIVHRLGIDVELTQRHDKDGNLVVEIRELTSASRVRA